VLEGREEELVAGDIVNVPANTKHNFINTGDVPLKLFTIYSPPEHQSTTVHKTKAEADAAEH
jgi:mannose-6-phosphate isomerase-like protein (cupin superfamily)